MVAGIVLKINAIYSAFLLEIIRGTQPVLEFNYGAKKYERVRETCKYVIVFCSIALHASVQWDARISVFIRNWKQ